MFDELDLLRGNLELQRLLQHYIQGAEADKDAWHDRLMTLEGTEPRELVKLHGLLIAFGWVDQNTGHTPVGQSSTIPNCYRVTTAGLRARKAIQIPREQSDPESDATRPAQASAANDPEGRKGTTRRLKQAMVDDADVPEVRSTEPVSSLA